MHTYCVFRQTLGIENVYLLEWILGWVGTIVFFVQNTPYTSSVLFVKAVSL